MSRKINLIEDFSAHKKQYCLGERPPKLSQAIHVKHFGYRRGCEPKKYINLFNDNIKLHDKLFHLCKMMFYSMNIILAIFLLAYIEKGKVSTMI
jgi:hypothetical protein